MRITFILPGHGAKPSGGFRVVYRYANGLAARGHVVTVVHPARLRIDTPLHKRPERLLHFVRRGFGGGYRPDGWFALDPRVRAHWVPSLHERRIPDGDAIVATACTTAEWLVGYGAAKGKPFYLIQSYETFTFPEARLVATWRLPATKIVISQWLKRIAEDMGESAFYVPNGTDSPFFRMNVDPALRSPATVAMMCHPAAVKGTDDGIAALALVRRRFPELRVSMFGIGSPPENLPEWVDYYRDPGQERLCELYNECAVFVAPSRLEGWGLPASEAMHCGCAIAATDIGGHREFALHEETALLSPPRDPSALAANIVRLIRDDGLRDRLARSGNARIRTFTWDRAVEEFENALTQN